MINPKRHYVKYNVPLSPLFKGWGELICPLYTVSQQFRFYETPQKKPHVSFIQIMAMKTLVILWLFL